VEADTLSAWRAVAARPWCEELDMSELRIDSLLNELVEAGGCRIWLVTGCHSAQQTRVTTERVSMTWPALGLAHTARHVIGCRVTQ